MSKVSRKLKEFFKKWFGKENPAEVKAEEAETIVDKKVKEKTEFKNSLEVDPIGTMEKELIKFELNVKDVSKNYYESKGYLKHYTDSVAIIDESISVARLAAKAIKSKYAEGVEMSAEDKTIITGIIADIEGKNRKKVTIENLITKTDAVTKKLLRQTIIMKTKYSNAKDALDEMKMQKNFTDAVSKFAKVIDVTGIDDNLDTAINDVSIKFNSANFELDDIIADNVDIEEVINKVRGDEKLNDFLKDL